MLWLCLPPNSALMITIHQSYSIAYFMYVDFPVIPTVATVGYFVFKEIKLLMND